MYDVPILFVIFRRKDAALQSFSRIRDARPARLYIAGDGPRPGVDGEAEQVEQTRKAVMDAIDWPCEVKTLFRDCNIGCGQGVYTAINWLFEHEERGIIIEDDCVLQPSFFPFAEELLERYKDDERIGMIDAANYVKGVEIAETYGFSRYMSTNGWATWRRAWKHMDLAMTWRGTPMEQSVIANVGYKGKDMGSWKYRIKAIDHNYVSAWDWQWYFSLAANNQLAIFPKYNLQTNIGFGEGATHTTQRTTPDKYIAHKELSFPLIHPSVFAPNIAFDHRFYKQDNTISNTIKQWIPFGLKNRLKKLLNR